MVIVRCKKTVYHQAKAGKLNVNATAVKDGVYGNPTVFLSPPIGEPIFLAMITDYTAKYGTYKAGGAAQKPAYEAAKAALLSAMDDQANYVDSIANGDPNIVMLGGFVPTKGTKSEVPTPTELFTIKLWRGAAGELIAECEAQPFVEAFICVLTAGAPLPPNVFLNVEAGQLMFNGGNTPGPTAGRIDCNPSRRKEFTNLTPGVIYYVTFFGVNASGVGPLSVPVGLLCG